MTLTDDEIWDMRVQGFSYGDIERKCKIDKYTAYLACYRVFERDREKFHDSQEMAILLELARLDAMLKKIWPMLSDDDKSLQTVKSVLQIMERRASYLGLDNTGMRNVPKDTAREIYEHMQELVHATGYGWQ